jgi:hypothetical protein
MLAKEKPMETTIRPFITALLTCPKLRQRIQGWQQRGLSKAIARGLLMTQPLNRFGSTATATEADALMKAHQKPFDRRQFAPLADGQFFHMLFL